MVKRRRKKSRCTFSPSAVKVWTSGKEEMRGTKREAPKVQENGRCVKKGGKMDGPTDDDATAFRRIPVTPASNIFDATSNFLK